MSNNPVIFCKAALCSLFVVVFAAVASGADGICVRVSPEGPLASPEAALAEVRRQRAIGGRDDVVATIEFGKGVYRISRTLALTAADSHLVMRGAGDGKTVFSGAREIRGFTRAADGTFRAPVPAGFTFDQLWVNGRRSCRARSPNKGYFYIRDSVDETVDPETGKPANLDRKAYLFAKKDAAQLAALGRDELSKVIVHVTYAWDEDFVRPSFADAATGIIKFCNEFGRSPMWGRWMTRCRFENFRSALDAPGEWFLDVKAGELLYVPRAGENPESTVAEAPVLSALVTVAGADGKPVRNVTFSGISFEHQGWKCGKTFFTGQSAAALQEAMVTADRCEGVRFERCGFSHTSSYALWFRDSCHDCSVSKSHFRDLGAGGVRLSRPLKAEIDRSLVTSRIAVDDNIIHDAGHLFQCGVGVLLQHAYDCRILHNEIFDVKYTGISHGWRWSYGKQHCGGHEIGYNHIHHLGKNEMCDMGGIYSLGPSPGTRVHNNWVHDVRSYLYTGSGGTGLYTDEGSTGIVFENNLVHDTRTSSVNQHYGRENTFRNNILAFCGAQAGGAVPVFIRHRTEPHLSCSVSNNIIVVAPGNAAVGKPNSMLEKDTVFKGNFYHFAGGRADDAFAGLSWKQWRALGMDKGGMTGDAKFADLAHRDFTLAPDSPALAMGFKPFDWRMAGLRDANRRTLAASMPIAPCAPEFEPPKVVARKLFETSFEVSKPGSPAPLRIGPRGGKILVTDKVAHTGSRSLAYVDGPKGVSYFPHSVQGMARAGSVLKYRFSILYEENTNFSFEMRDYGGKPLNGQFSTGPQITVKNGVMSAPGFVSRLAAPGKWITCDIEHTLGPVDTPGRSVWKVSFRDDTGASETSGVIKAAPDYRQPTWAGMMSWATCDTCFYLDDIRYEWL